MNTLKAIFKLARPKQWVKNIFVLTAIIFSGRVSDPESIVTTLLAFAAFCLASSSIYYINDYRDLEEDKKHPTKRNRPLASGALPKWVGIIGFFVLLAAAIGIPLITLNKPTTVVIVFYLVLNFAYSFGLKNIVIIDVLCIATSFVLRILAGAAALSVLPSAWLVLCGVMISLFLGFTKRRAEVVLLGDQAREHRKVLAHYSPVFLDQMVSIVTAATVVGYVLYTVDERTVQLVESRALLLSVPLVLYGIFRYLYLVYHAESGGDPTRTVFTDIPLLITGVLWGILCTSVILLGGKFWSLIL
ncbi:MAG: decaprenyl-phosphate phosphoribosyltransferase [Deltaproteobacteria bacterium]|nr:decaprenyl-phosphate phosphoribosyltransferase [Deltaproteobacteria bacterium]